MLLSPCRFGVIEPFIDDKVKRSTGLEVFRDVSKVVEEMRVPWECNRLRHSDLQVGYEADGERQVD